MPCCTSCGSFYSGGFCKVCGPPAKKKNVYRIPRKSKKRQKEEKEYLKLRAEFLNNNPRCAVYPELRSEDVHHMQKRGKNYLNVSTWLAVSRKAHREIEDNPEWAYQMGYSKRVNSKQ